MSAATLDEAPDAYKSAEDILGPIAETVDIIEVRGHIARQEGQSTFLAALEASFD